MRPLVVLVLAPILALALVVSAGILVRDQPSTLQPKSQGIVWSNRVFTSKAEFARWLERHNSSYEQWVKLHPSAFRKEPPVLAARPADDDRDFARILAPIALGVLALLLAIAIIRSGRGTLAGLRRARPRTSPLTAAPARTLPGTVHSTVGPPAHAAAIALPNSSQAAPSRRGGSKVVPIHVPYEGGAEPAFARPAASHEAPVLDLRSALVTEPAELADLEPEPEPENDPQLLVVAEPAAAPWSEAALEPQSAREPEQEVSVEHDAPPEPVPTEPARRPVLQRPVLHPPPHPPPVVRRKRVVPAEPAAPTKRAMRPKPPATTKAIPITPPIAVPTPAVEVPAASAPPVEQPATPTPHAIEEQLPPEREIAAPDGAIVCQIGMWQGYLKSQFFASAVGPDGQEYAVAQSERFRSKNPLVRDDAAAAAHAQITQELVELGWTPDGHGPEWWALRFRLDDAADS